MRLETGGAARATEAGENESLRLYEQAKLEAQRDALELLRQCNGQRIDRIEAAARALTITAGRLAGFATNLCVALLVTS